MKKLNIKWILFFFLLPFLNSCNWEELPAYEEAEITAVQFYHRWASDEKDPITNEPVVKEKRLFTDCDIDSESGYIKAVIEVPEAGGEFTEDIRKSISLEKLWGQVTLSPAARITPIEGSVSLGTPDNWTTERKFQVQAADGTKKIWTIKVSELKK